MEVKLISYTRNPVETIEEAASTCYDSTPTGGRIMNHCYKSGHHSVLEFADFTFKITGVSRALTHQLVRHRIASFAQRSQRYCTEDGFEFVIPDSISRNQDAIDTYEHFMDRCQLTYDELIKLGVPAEDARMVLPNGCCTQICVKMNLRAFMHFCNERLCSCAQWEIRKMAKLMVAAVEEICSDVTKFCVPKCEIHAPYCFCTEPAQRTCKKHPLLSNVYGNTKPAE